MKILLVFLIPLPAWGQFKKQENSYLKERYVKYYNSESGIIVQKVFNSQNDSINIRYEIGLIIYRNGRSSDDFMNGSGHIIFDDKTYLVFTDPVYVNYFQAGKHQYSIKHILTLQELKELQTKKIESFVVSEFSNSLDKWQKQEMLKVFKDIETQ